MPAFSPNKRPVSFGLETDEYGEKTVAAGFHEIKGDAQISGTSVRFMSVLKFKIKLKSIVSRLPTRTTSKAGRKPSISILENINKTSSKERDLQEDPSPPVLMRSPHSSDAFGARTSIVNMSH